MAPRWSSSFGTVQDDVLRGTHLKIPNHIAALAGQSSQITREREKNPWLNKNTMSESNVLPFVPVGSPSRCGDVTVCVYGINQPNLPTPFYSVLVTISVFMALLTVFYSINSPDNSPLSHSVLLDLSPPYWSFQLDVSLRKSPTALI